MQRTIQYAVVQALADWCRATLCACALLLASESQADAVRERILGLNTSFMDDWASVLYADALKQRRDWIRPDGGAAATNPTGHPTENASVLLSGSLPLRAGTYRIFHNGNFSLSANRGSVGTFTIDAGSGLKVSEWILGSRAENARLTVSNLTLAPTVFAVMRPVSEGSSESHGLEELTDRSYKANLGPTEVLRYMDTLETNANPSVSWSNRIRPHEWPRLKRSGGSGQPLEHIVRMSNETSTDPWINIPHQADDDYILKVAQLFRFGSDGSLPFTSDAERLAATAEGKTVFPPLDAGRRLYIEYSNEVWNSQSTFSQTAWVTNAAVAEVASNSTSQLNYDALDSASGIYQRTLQARYYVRRSVFISNSFRSVFGDTAMMARVRPMLFWQQTNSNSHGSLRLNYLTDYYGRVREGNPVARPPSYYFWGGGAAGYYSPNDGVTELDALWNSGNMNPENWRQRLIADGALALGNGLRFVIYEGGPGFGPDNGSTGSHPLAEAAVSDPRIIGEIHEHHDLFNRYGGSLFAFYQHQGGIDAWNWTFTYHLDDPATLKMQAYAQLASRPLPVEDRATIMPGSIPGSAFSVASRRSSTAPTPGTNGSVSLNDGEWAIYDVRTLAPGTFSATVTYTGGAPGESIEVSADGVPLGVVAAPSGTSAQLGGFFFDAEADRRIAVRVRALGGSLTVSGIGFDTTAIMASTILAPPEGTSLAPGQTVLVEGTATLPLWSIVNGSPASGSGYVHSFVVDLDATNGDSVQVSLNGSGGTATRSYPIVDSKPAIVQESKLPSSGSGAPYDVPLLASGGDSPLSWSMVSGAIPAGIVLGNAGRLTGSSKASGLHTFRLRVIDRDGDSDERTFTLRIGASPAFAEADGILSMEFESAHRPIPSDFILGTDPAASGERYLAPAPGKHQTGTVPNSTDAVRLAQLPLRIRNEGDYVLHVRMAVPNSGNSFFYRFDGGPWLTFNDRSSSVAWSWQSYGSARLHPLTAGDHLLEFTWRERDTLLDKLILQKVGIADPVMLGPPESTLMAPILPYDSWSAAMGLAGAAAERTADPDGDGQANLLEFALGGSPTAPEPAAVQVQHGGDGSTVVSFLRARDDLVYTLQVSTDLAVWDWLDSNPGTPGAWVQVDAGNLPQAHFFRLVVSEE